MAFAAFVLASAFTAYAVFYSQTLPSTQSQTQQLASYIQQGSYDYVATLSPNALYNTTSLRNGQGTLFVTITKFVNVTFVYDLSVSGPVNIELTSTYSVTVNSPVWNLTLYSIFATPVLSSNQNTRISQIFTLNITKIMGLIRQIETQTGYASPRYSIGVQPSIAGSIKASGESAAILFQPLLNLTIVGGIITPEGTMHSQSSSLTKTTTVVDAQTMTLRLFSFFGIGFSLVGVFASLWHMTRPKKDDPEGDLETAIEVYRSLIVMTGTPPPEEARFIDAQGWENLARAADTLGKPILHFTKREESGETQHSFYVLDASTCYTYTVKIVPRPRAG